MRYGVLGGTFDPVHYGHLMAAEEARSALGLDRVFFVPARMPPHKLGHEISSDSHRMAMLGLAIAGNDAFALSRVDLDRPGPSFTVDTITLLRQEWGQAIEIFFIMGSDSLCDIPTWRDPARLMRLCRMVVVGRPGFEPDLARLQPVVPDIQDRVVFVRMPLMGVSSTDIRKRVAEGRPIRYQLPEPVADYIHDRGLYNHSASTSSMA